MAPHGPRTPHAEPRTRAPAPFRGLQPHAYAPLMRGGLLSFLRQRCAGLPCHLPEDVRSALQVAYITRAGGWPPRSSRDNCGTWTSGLPSGDAVAGRNGRAPQAPQAGQASRDGCAWTRRDQERRGSDVPPHARASRSARTPPRAYRGVPAPDEAHRPKTSSTDWPNITERNPSKSEAGGASEEPAKVAVSEVTALEAASGFEPENRGFAGFGPGRDQRGHTG
jgi:hypothetical protein